MKIISNGYGRMAIQSMRSNQWRSFLTILGVIIGVFAIATIVSIGQGVTNQITGQITNLGQDIITIRPGNLTTNSSFDSLKSLINLSNDKPTSSLSNQDVSIIGNTKNVKVIVPLTIVPGNVQKNNRVFNDAIVLGASDNLNSILGRQIQYGDFYTSDDLSTVAVIGSNIDNELFPGEVGLGRGFQFRGQDFLIRGQLNQFSTSPLSVDLNFNNAIFIPESLAMQLTNNTAPIFEILVKPTDSHKTASLVKTLNQELISAHGGAHDFSVLTQSDNVAITNKVLDLVRSLINVIALIALLTGGISIMNSMVVAVTERTQEIGLRKALGATNRQILNQFLVESVMLSVLGGILGIIMTLFVVGGLRLATNLQPIFNWPFYGLAVAISLFIGILFGIAPALKAARKDPITALRYP